MSNQTKAQFIQDHNECLERFKVMLSEFDIKVFSMINLDRIDDLCPPTTHKFGAWRLLYGDKIAMSFMLASEDIKAQSFDVIIPYWADFIREKLRPVAMEVV